MPVPASFIDITSDPFTQLVTQSMFNVDEEQWFRYVGLIPITIGTQTTSGGTFVPDTLFYESDGTTLLKDNTGSASFGQWVALESINTYYIKIKRHGGGPSNSDFTFNFATAPLNSLGSIATGDLIINDDQNLAAVIVSSLGVLKTFVSSIPGGEMGAILPSNVTVWQDFYGKYSLANRIAAFNLSFTYLGSVAAGITFTNFPKFAIDKANNQFYVINQLDELWTISATGVAAYTGFDLPGVATQAIAVSADGNTLYFAHKSQDGIIHTVDLNTLTLGADFYTIPGFVNGTDEICRTFFGGFPGDMFSLDDGGFVFWWYDVSAGHYWVVYLDNTGTLIHSTSITRIDHLAYINGDSAHILLWQFTNDSISEGKFSRLTLATGVLDNDFTQDLFFNGINTKGTGKFGISNSCTFLRVQDSVAPPGGSGTIQVVKVTSPPGITQSFSLSAGGGLSPTDFNLNGDGAQQVFTLVPIGDGYSIEETPNSSYETTYVVSNDSPIDNISVEEDEIVVVTVTNRALGAEASGIYKLVPGKRNDTLWTDDFQDTDIVKIPQPFAKTAMLGN